MKTLKNNMPEHPYKNREIDTFMNEIREALDRIETQTTKTNGRVTSLEQWRWYQTGAITIMSVILCSIVIPIILKSL